MCHTRKSLSILCISLSIFWTNVFGMANLQTIIQAALPAIVNIKTIKQTASNQQSRLPDDLQTKNITIGSGVIINQKAGIIISNAHVVKQAKSIIVTLNDGERLLAKLLGKSKDYDIAVLQVNLSNAAKQSIAQLQFANSDLAKAGQRVVAIGSPYNLSQSASAGIISALNRSSTTLLPYANFIQTDAPINPGSSGGALIDANGKLLGLNTALLSTTKANAGVGFAIPSNLVKEVAMQLATQHKLNSSILGIMVQNLKPEIKAAFKYPYKDGVIITKVMPDSPAAAAGLLNGDIIHSINNNIIFTSKKLQENIKLLAPGSKIKLLIWRNQKAILLQATVADATKITAGPKNLLTGLRLQDTIQQNPDNTDTQGALVLGVSPTSPAYVAGISAGDIIDRAENKRVANIQRLDLIAKRHTKHMLVEVKRGSGELFFMLKSN